MLTKHFENYFSKIPNVKQTNFTYFLLKFPTLTRPIFQFSANISKDNQNNFTFPTANSLIFHIFHIVQNRFDDLISSVQTTLLAHHKRANSNLFLQKLWEMDVINEWNCSHEKFSYQNGHFP